MEDWLKRQLHGRRSQSVPQTQSGLDGGGSRGTGALPVQWKTELVQEPLSWGISEKDAGRPLDGDGLGGLGDLAWFGDSLLSSFLCFPLRLKHSMPMAKVSLWNI